jgi:hypothetical protein
MSSLIRVRLIASAISVFGALLAGVLFLAALFSRSHVLGTAALVALITSLFANAVIGAWRTYVLARTGRWTTFYGRPTSRSDQPARYWTWLALHALIAVVWCTPAAFLTWSLLTSNL